MQIKGNNVNLNQKVNQDSQKGKNLAKEIMIFADQNNSAVSKMEFQNKLDKMKKLSTQDLIKFIRSFDKDESIIELICDEIGDDKKVRKEACKKVLNALVNKAKELGIETSDFEKQFTEELGSQFGFLGKYINTDKLDSIINALTQSIENRQNLTNEDLQTIQNISAEEGANQSNDVLENRLEKAYSAFGERVGEDGEMTTKDKDGNLYNGQMQRDGIAADIADGVSRIWGSDNTAAKVRKDLKATNAQLQQLKEAKAQGEDAYKAKFKEIFGVEYDYANILAYQKAEASYINASSNHEFEMLFNRTLKTLLSPAPLREEVRYDTPDPMTNMVTTTVTATKEQVYMREFENLAEFLTQKDTDGNVINGGEILNKAFEEKGVANGTIEEKFEVLKQIAQALSKQLHSATLEAGGGKEFSEVQAMYDNSYKAAYGVENDIMKRVTDYNVSQEMGAGVVKAGATIAASLVAAFTGCGLVGVAAWTAGTTIGAEVIDRGTSGKALDALREQGLGEYLETTLKDVNWEATLKQAAMSGGAVLIGGAVSQGITAVMAGKSSVAQFAAMLGADVITDASMEFLTTKQITWQGMVFTVLLSAIGNYVQVQQMKNAAETLTGADDALDGVKAKADISANTAKTTEYTFNAKSARLGKEMMEADGIVFKKVHDYCEGQHYGFDDWELRIDNGKGLRKTIVLENKGKNFSKIHDEVASRYYHFKQSGLDIETYLRQNPNTSDLLGFLVAQTPEEAIDFRAITARVNKEIGEQYPDAAKILNEKIYGKGDQVGVKYSDPERLQILEAFQTDPELGLSMIYDDYVTKSSLNGYVDDVKRLAFSADGPNAASIKQGASEVEDLARQATALRAQGKTTLANDIAHQAIVKAQEVSALATENINITTFMKTEAPQAIMKPQTADNIKGQGISFKQAPDQPNYSATRIEWGETIEETIALNKKNGINLELVKGDDGQYFLGIKDIWSDGYHRVDRNSVVMHYGDYAPTPENYVAANPEWVRANANPDGTVKDCAVVANDTGAKILENSYVTADGQKIDFATMEPGTKVHKDPNAVVNAVAYDSPQTLKTLEGNIETDITMGDVDGNVYNNFKQLKKQITKGQLVPNEADPYSARFIELVKAGKDDEAIELLKQVSFMKTEAPQAIMKPQTADNIKGQGISFKQAPDQPNYSATRIEWGETIEETIALNKKNGINLELVKGDDGQYFLGIKDIWSDGYHRVDRNSVVMHYGDYAPTPENYVAANPEWVRANANPDGTVKDCAVVANDTGAKILENSYVTADGQKIDFATMEPGTKVHKDPNAVVNAVAYDSPQTLKTLEGNIETDITMGDVDGNVYNNFKQLKKQITKGQLVPNEADPYSARFIELVKAGKDDEAIELLKQVTKNQATTPPKTNDKTIPTLWDSEEEHVRYYYNLERPEPYKPENPIDLYR